MLTDGIIDFRHTRSHYNFLYWYMLAQSSTTVIESINVASSGNYERRRQKRRSCVEDDDDDDNTMPSLFRFGKRKKKKADRRSSGTRPTKEAGKDERGDHHDADGVTSSSAPSPRPHQRQDTMVRSTSLSIRAPRRFSFSALKKNAGSASTVSTEDDVAPIVRPDGWVEAVVPPGVVAGGVFRAVVGGRAWLVACPDHPSRLSDRRARFRPPRCRRDAARPPRETRNGWTAATTTATPERAVRWARFDRAGAPTPTPLALDARAWLVAPRWDDEDDPDMLQGAVELVPTEDHEQPTDNVVADVQGRERAERERWLFDECDRLGREAAAATDDDKTVGGALNVSIRRETLVTDTLNAVMSLTRRHLQLPWRVTFDGEDSYDSSLATREWFETVADEMLHPENGLFQFSPCVEGETHTYVQINPCSDMAFPDTHLICFRVLGRVLGKAFLDGRPLPNHLAPPLVKALVGWPLDLSDLRYTDDSCWHFLNEVESTDPGRLAELGLTFTAVRDVAGVPEPVELVPDGKSVPVDETNVAHYLEASLEYYLLGETRAQVAELCAGFFDAVPARLASVFDPDEMSTLMSRGRR